MRGTVLPFVLTAVLLTAPAFAADPPCPHCQKPCVPKPAVTVTKVFSVTDLVTPIPNMETPAAPRTAWR